MRLFSRWQNSAGERVRIALHLKNIDHDYVPVSTLTPEAYRRIDPQGLLPALDVDGRIIAQSGAILAYLEERFPDPPLLPQDLLLRAEARAFSDVIRAEMHALTVQRVRHRLQNEAGLSDDDVRDWVHHWLRLGLDTLEAMLGNRRTASPFCFGDHPGWADLHLVPQLSACRRLGFVLSAYPLLTGIETRCVALEAFLHARPEAQPDWPGP